MRSRFISYRIRRSHHHSLRHRNYYRTMIRMKMHLQNCSSLLLETNSSHKGI